MAEGLKHPSLNFFKQTNIKNPGWPVTCCKTQAGLNYLVSYLSLLSIRFMRTFLLYAGILQRQIWACRLISRMLILSYIRINNGETQGRNQDRMERSRCWRCWNKAQPQSRAQTWRECSLKNVLNCDGGWSQWLSGLAQEDTWVCPRILYSVKAVSKEADSSVSTNCTQ